MRRVAVLANRHAGAGRAGGVARWASDRLRQQGLRVEELHGRDPGHAEALARAAVAEGWTPSSSWAAMAACTSPQRTGRQRRAPRPGAGG